MKKGTPEKREASKTRRERAAGMAIATFSIVRTAGMFRKLRRISKGDGATMIEIGDGSGITKGGEIIGGGIGVTSGGVVGGIVGGGVVGGVTGGGGGGDGGGLTQTLLTKICGETQVNVGSGGGGGGGGFPLLPLEEMQDSVSKLTSSP